MGVRETGAGSGYAAGYYAYLWAEVMEAQVFGLFDGRDLFDPVVAGKVKTLVYESGDRTDPRDLFQALTGETPNPARLLSRLAPPAPAADHSAAEAMGDSSLRGRRP